MTRLRGRAPLGERLIAKVPHGHWKTTTLIAALDSAGIRCSTVVDGAVNADVFEAFVEQVLTPTLRAGDVVVMDNLSAHKASGVSETLEAVGASVWYLPAYSPDLNPIEQAFAKLKAFLRAARPRSFDQVVELLAIALELFSPSECLNFVRHCGYRVSTPL